MVFFGPRPLTFLSNMGQSRPARVSAGSGPFAALGFDDRPAGINAMYLKNRHPKVQSDGHRKLHGSPPFCQRPTGWPGGEEPSTASIADTVDLSCI